MPPGRKRRSNETDALAGGSQPLTENEPTSPKVKKVDNEPVSDVPACDTHILDMNDDCIDTICNLLPIDDLCSMGQTCKRLQSIAGDYFQRNYPNNYIRIQSFRRRSVFYMYPDEKYVEDLKPFIRNVSIQEYKGSACVNYIKTNFCENLREIALHGIHSELDVSHGLQIKDQLKHLESIKFVNCSVGDIYQILLKHCEHLKHIGFDEPIQYNGRVTWDKQTFPTLQSIAYFDEANTNRADIGGFLRRNQQIKTISCKGTNVQNTVFQKARDLDLLVMCYDSHKDFNSNYKLLKDYSINSQTKRIKVEFGKPLSSDYIAKIATIERVHGFRGHLLESAQFPDILTKMHHLTVLQLLTFGNVTQVFIKRLASCLPHLEELHFATVDTGRTFKNLLIPFCQNPKLKKIVIFSTQVMYKCTKTDICDINKVRASINSKSMLTIYMQKKVILNISFKIPENSKVILKPMSEHQRDAYSFDL